MSLVKALLLFFLLLLFSDPLTFLHRDEKETLEQEVESEKEEDDSEEEMETSERQQDVRSLGSVLEPSLQLSREEERKLRSVRKTDFSWVSSYVNY